MLTKWLRVGEIIICFGLNNNVRARSDLGVTVMGITVLPTRVAIARLTNAVMRAMGGTVKATTTRGMRLVYQVSLSKLLLTNSIRFTTI